MLGNAIEDKLELIITGLADLLAALGIFVVKDVVSAQLLYEFKIVRRCGCEDFCA